VPRYLIIAVLAAGLVSTAAAQRGGLDDIDVGAAGTCSSASVIDQIWGPGTSQVGRGHTFVATKNPRVYRGTPAASPTIQEQPSLFSKVILFGQAESGERRYLARWERAGQVRCGWMQADDLVIKRKDGRLPPIEALSSGPPPMQAYEIPGGDKSSILTVKALGANLNVAGSEGLKTFESPDARVLHQTLGLFETFTVYDIRAGLVPSGSRDDRYYLIGREGRGGESMYGWVHADDVYLWNSRLTAFWAGTGKGRGWLDDRMIGTPFMTETADYVEPANQAVPKYPIIEQQPSTRLVQEKAKILVNPTEKDYARLVDRYRLVVPGRACPKNNTDESKCMSAEEVAAARKRLAEIASANRRIDVLFLIDGTTSMDVYFPSTSEAIQTFTSQLGGTKDRPSDLSIRVGASVYGDYLGDKTSAGIFYKNLAEFHDPARGESSRLNALRDYRPSETSDPLNKDKLEAPFAALIEAAQKTPWRDGIRAIVHIADHGNRDTGKTSGEEKSALVETVKLSEVVDALNRNRIIYVPISVVGRPKETEPREIQARNAFLRQGQEIKTLTLSGSGSVTPAYTSTDRQETPEQRRKAVFDALEKTSDIYARGKSLVDLREGCARNPGGSLCKELDQFEKSGAADSPTQIARRLTDVQGLTRQQIENIESRNQTVSYLWVPPLDKSGNAEVPTLKYYVALNETGRDAVVRAMEFICDTLKPTNATADIDLVAGLDRAIGKISETKPTDLIGLRLSLPVLERNPALNIELSLLERAVRTKNVEALKRWRLPYCKSAYFMKLIEPNRRIDTDKVRQDPETGALTPLEQVKTYDWEVKTSRGESFFYVPTNYLPQ
jgi:hypothetical protein